MTNADRAEKARMALDAYWGSQSDTEPTDDRIGDLLCDLLHLIAQESAEEDEQITSDEMATILLNLADRAFSNYEDEQNEEEENDEDEEEE